MAYEPKEGDFSLFRTKEKKTDKSPDFWGTAIVDGVPRKLVAWRKQVGNRPAFLSGRIEVDDGHAKGGNIDDDRDGIPF